MSQQGVLDVIAALTVAGRKHDCDTIPELMHHFQVANGAALLARVGCAGNSAARWERLTYDIARQLLPGDELTPLIAVWRVTSNEESTRVLGTRHSALSTIN